jgi:hypothetical protein
MRIQLALASLLVTGTCVLVAASLTSAQQEKVKPATGSPKLGPEPAPPPDQTYIGVTKCAACHFEQYQDWRKQQDKHVKALGIVPAAYRKNSDCLKCHTTGHGEPSGFKTAADKSLAGVTCEACHGPGSAHAEVAKPFEKKKQLTAEEEKIARDSIYRMLPENVCVTCHSARAHHKHPDYKKAQ